MKSTISTTGNLDKRWNSITRPILALLLAGTLVVSSGCTTFQTIPMNNAFPVSASVHPSGPAVTVLPIEEDLRGVSDVEAYKKNPTYLGKGVDEFVTILFVPLLPTYKEFHADVPRTDIVRTAVLSRLKNSEIPATYQIKNGVEHFMMLPDDRLGLVLRIRTFNVDTSGFLLIPTIIVNVGGFPDRLAHVVLDCQLWQAGNDAPIWEGSGEGQSGDGLNVAVSAAVDQCLTKSRIVEIRTKLSSEKYAKLLASGREQEKTGRNGEALGLFSQAYRTALTPVQSLDVIKAMAHLIRAMPGKPTLPEDVRKFDVEAVGAVNDKKLADAADFYSQAIDVAPWYPDNHYNRGYVLGEIGDLPAAIQEMKYYLVLAPNARDARAVQDNIYDWERKAGTPN